MEIKDRTVTVKQLPENLTTGQGKMFIREMQRCIDIDRPRIVLDCSTLPQLSKPTIYLLLCCLEEAMKHNGDVKLAALPTSASDGSDISGIYRLFDIYTTTDEAVRSFHRLHESAFFREPTPSTT